MRAALVRPRSLWLLGAAALLALAFAYASRYPTFIDEAWFSNPAYDLSQGSGLGTSLLGGWLRIDEHTYWQPPLQFLLLAGSFKVLGLSLLSARLVSIAAAVVAVAATYLLTRRVYGERAAPLAALLLAVNSLFFFTGTQARMDITVAALTSLAVLAAVIALDTGRTRWFAASGALGALALLAHPNGGLGLAAVGVIILLFGKRWRPLIPAASSVALGVLVTLLPYAVFIAQDPAAFWDQVRFNMVRSSFDDGLLLDRLAKEADRYQALIAKQQLPALLLFALASGAVAWRGSRNERAILTAAAVHLLLFALLVDNPTFRYFVIVLPFLSVLLAGRALQTTGWLRNRAELLDRARLRRLAAASLIPGALLLFVLFNLAATLFVLGRYRSYSEDALLAEMQQELPNGGSVLATGNFWFGFVDREFYDFRLLPLAENWYIDLGDGSQVSRPSYSETLALLRPDIVILDEKNLKEWPALNDYLRAFLDVHGEKLWETTEPRYYGRVEAYRVRWSQVAGAERQE